MYSIQVRSFSDTNFNGKTWNDLWTHRMLVNMCTSKDEYLRYCDNNRDIVIEHIMSYLKSLDMNAHVKNDIKDGIDRRMEISNKDLYLIEEKRLKRGRNLTSKKLQEYPILELLSLHIYWKNEGKIIDYNSYEIDHINIPADYRDPIVLDMTKLGKLFMVI